MDMDISMDIHVKSVDMDTDMDGKFHIHDNYHDIFTNYGHIAYGRINLRNFPL